VKPPKDNELGWKETLRMNPLEDIIVAIKAKKPALGGFGLPLSVRARDPSQPLGTPTGFTQVDPLTGTPATIFNQEDNYGWEYVWHCHILGHEENDFMRPVKFNANEAIPTAPTLNTVVAVLPGTATLNWTDHSSTEYQFAIKRAAVTTAGVGAYSIVGTALANSQIAIDTLPQNPPANLIEYSYKVSAVGAAGSADSNASQMVIGSPSGVSLTVGVPSSISWTAPSGTAPTNYFVESSQTGTGNWKTVGTTSGTSINLNVAGAAALTSGNFSNYSFRVTARTNYGAGIISSQPSVLNVAVRAPTNVVLTTTGRVGNLTWVPGVTDPVGTAYIVEYRTRKVGGASYGGWATIATPSSFALVNGTDYQFRVTAKVSITASTTVSAVSNSTTVVFTAATTATNLHLVSAVAGTGTNGATTSQKLVTVGWTAPASVPNQIPVLNYTVFFANSPTAGGTWVTTTGNVRTVTYPLSNSTNPWYVSIRTNNDAGVSVTTTPIAITIP
jgi:hypothetical protein